MTPDIRTAIADRRLLGTIIQDPFQLGKTATQELITILRQRRGEMPSSPKEILVPVKKITRETLPSD
jgi:ABC-type sugar transport system substrate-binding protein